MRSENDKMGGDTGMWDNTHVQIKKNWACSLSVEVKWYKGEMISS